MNLADKIKQDLKKINSLSNQQVTQKEKKIKENENQEKVFSDVSSSDEMSSTQGYIDDKSFVKKNKTFLTSTNFESILETAENNVNNFENEKDSDSEENSSLSDMEAIKTKMELDEFANREYGLYD